MLTKNELAIKINEYYDEVLNVLSYVSDPALEAINVKKYQGKYMHKGFSENVIVYVKNEGLEGEYAYESQHRNFELVKEIDIKTKEKIDSGEIVNYEVEKVFHKNRMAKIKVLVNNQDSTKFNNKNYCLTKNNGGYDLKEVE